MRRAILLATETDVGREWARLRGMLRFAILCGDIVIAGDKWEEWGPGGTLSAPPHLRGVDSNRRLAFWDVLKALWQLNSNDPFGYELLRRHVGYHCEGTRCRPIDEEWPTIGHWHQISLVDIRSRTGQKQDQLIARRDTAMQYVVEFCIGS